MTDHDDGLPFPGMNPYLEARHLWPEVHTKLISEMHYFLCEALPPKYTVTMEERVIVEETIGDTARQRYAIPDINVAGGETPAVASVVASVVEPDAAAVTVLLPELRPVRERFIEIRTPGRLASVTILEVLSHSNKPAGPGRRDYLDKRQRILESATHLIEIDLLRANNPMPTDGYDGDASLSHHGQPQPKAASSSIVPIRYAVGLSHFPGSALEPGRRTHRCSGRNLQRHLPAWSLRTLR